MIHADLNVGDKIRILNGSDMGIDTQVSWLSSMNRAVGRVGVISMKGDYYVKINFIDRYDSYSDVGVYSYIAEWLELVEKCENPSIPLKKGDKVRIRDFPQNYASSMRKYIGLETIVIRGGGSCSLNIDQQMWSWSPDWLEKLED